jgi:hypothetical protein
MLAALLEPGIYTRDKRGFALERWRELRSGEADGDSSAERIVDAMGYDGLYRALDRESKRDTGVFRDSETGEVLNVPKVGSIPVYSEDGSTTGERQLKLWQEMSREEFRIWLEQQAHHAQSLTFKVRCLRLVLNEWDRYPEATTAREVCERSGIDPDQLDLAA